MRIVFDLVDKTEDLSPGHSLSALRECSEEARGEPGYIGVFATRPGSRNIKRLLLIKENQISQVKEFSAFLSLARCKSLGSLKSFLRYAPQLSGATILCFFILSLRRVRGWGWLPWLRAWQWAAHLSSSWVPLGLRVQGSCSGKMSATSFVYWYGRQHFFTDTKIFVVVVILPKLALQFCFACYIDLSILISICIVMRQFTVYTDTHAHICYVSDLFSEGYRT